MKYKFEFIVNTELTMSEFEKETISESISDALFGLPRANKIQNFKITKET